MRKGHRRTQSAYIASSTLNQQTQHQSKTAINSNYIMRLLEASENKIQSKVINYQRLQVSSLQENNFLKFGNFTIHRNNKNSEVDKIQKETEHRNNPHVLQNPNINLNSIPQNSKSSQISSKKLSKQGGCKQDDIPLIPTKKTKHKRASDFKRLEMQQKQKQTSDLSYSVKIHRLGTSLKKKQC